MIGSRCSAVRPRRRSRNRRAPPRPHLIGHPDPEHRVPRNRTARMRRDESPDLDRCPNADHRTHALLVALRLELQLPSSWLPIMVKGPHSARFRRRTTGPETTSLMRMGSPACTGIRYPGRFRPFARDGRGTPIRRCATAAVRDMWISIWLEEASLCHDRRSRPGGAHSASVNGSDTSTHVVGSATTLGEPGLFKPPLPQNVGELGLRSASSRLAAPIRVQLSAARSPRQPEPRNRPKS